MARSVASSPVQQGDDPRHGTGRREDLHVALTHDPAARQLIGNGFEGLGGDTDDGRTQL